MIRGPLLALLVAAAGLVVACGLAAQVIGGDPMLAAELLVAVAIAAWLILVVRSARPAAAARRRLDRVAVRGRLHETEVRLIESSTPSEAFVAGALQPAIYVARGLLDVLDKDELEGVLLHEEHHRRRRDPLRAIAISSWGGLFGRLPVVRDWIARRLAQLEVDADRFAVAQGASPAAIASALLKCDPTPGRFAVGFASAVDHRVRGLLDARASLDLGASAPIEWLGPAAMAIAVFVCHLFVG